MQSKLKSDQNPENRMKKCQSLENKAKNFLHVKFEERNEKIETPGAVPPSIQTLHIVSLCVFAAI